MSKKYPCDGENGTCPYDAEYGSVCHQYCYDNNDYDVPDVEVTKPTVKLIVNIQELLVEGVYVNSQDFDIEVLVIETDTENDQSEEEEECMKDKISSFTNDEQFKQVKWIEKTLINHDVEV